MDVNNDRLLITNNIPYGSILKIKNGQKITKGQPICAWDPFNAVIISALCHWPILPNEPYAYNGELPFTKRLDGASWSGALTYGTIANEAPEVQEELAEMGDLDPRAALRGDDRWQIDYDFNAYRAKYKDHANVEFVIPQEGTIAVPYVMSLVNKGPNAENGRKVLDFVLSDEGQAIWANAYLRPVCASAVPKDVQARFLPASEYARAKTVDYGRMAEVQKGFSERYLKIGGHWRDHVRFAIRADQWRS